MVEDWVQWRWMVDDWMVMDWFGIDWNRCVEGFWMVNRRRGR